MKRFTEREKQVLELLVKGYSNPEISKAMTISNHTTKAFLASIYKKFGVTNRVQAAIEYTKIKN